MKTFRETAWPSCPSMLAKGLEWPMVFIAGCEDGLMPCTLFGGKDADEERRLFFCRHDPGPQTPGPCPMPRAAP